MSQHEVLGSVRAVNVGPVRSVEWRDRVWSTGIFKEPVEGPVLAQGVQISGDQQADLSVHGGPEKSVYAYPDEHYGFWRETLGGSQLELLEVPGAFGENLTTRGILETGVSVGDRLRIGGALLRVTEPRLPCAKLGLRFQDPLMTRRFYHARRNGIYFAIDEAGEIQAGDSIRVEFRHPVRLSIQEMVDFETGVLRTDELRKRGSEHPALSASWRERFRLPSRPSGSH